MGKNASNLMTAGHENLSILRPLLIVKEREVKKYFIKKYPKGKGDLLKNLTLGCESRDER